MLLGILKIRFLMSYILCLLGSILIIKICPSLIRNRKRQEPETK